MRLHKTARFGDTAIATDAYNPATTIAVQLAPVELFKVEGTAIRVRQMSVDPALNIPTRRVLAIDGETYLVGDDSADFWRGTRIRNNHVIQAAPWLASRNSIASELAGTAATTTYAALDFAKYSTDQRDTSEYLPQYHIYVARGESVPELFKIDNLWYLVKEWYLSEGGINVVLANELTGTVFETITHTVRTYVPATDTWTESTVSFKTMRVRYTEHFKYLTKTSENYERGDQQVFILKSAATPKVSDKLTFSDGVFVVLSIQDEGATWSCHVRRS